MKLAGDILVFLACRTISNPQNSFISWTCIGVLFSSNVINLNKLDDFSA